MIPAHPITAPHVDAPRIGQPAVVVYDSSGYLARYPIMPGDEDGAQAAAAGRRFALIHWPGAVVAYFTGRMYPEFKGPDLRTMRGGIKGLWWKAYLWAGLAMFALAVVAWLIASQ